MPVRPDAGKEGASQREAVPTMSFLASKAYYRICRAVAILLVPVLLSALFLLKVEKTVRARGLIESARQDVVCSPVKETIVKAIHFSSGDQVRKGDVVIEFEDIPGYANLAAQTEVKIHELEDRRGRMGKLRKSGTITDAHLKELDFQIAELKLKFEGLKEKAERFTIRSPMDGEIVSIMVRTYEQVGIGRELFAVSAGNAKVIKCAIPERQYTYLSSGQPVNIKSELYNYLKYDIYRGRLASISPYG